MINIAVAKYKIDKIDERTTEETRVPEYQIEKISVPAAGSRKLVICARWEEPRPVTFVNH